MIADIQAARAAHAVIASSTRGCKPSGLQYGAVAPGQIVVAHPFNPVYPVYLLPLVELAPAAATNAAEVMMTRVGADEDSVANGLSYFTVETTVNDRNETQAGEAIEVYTLVTEGRGEALNLCHPEWTLSTGG